MIKNKDAESQKAAAAVYSHDKEPGGKHRFSYSSDTVALEYKGKGVLKKTFQEVHNGTANEKDTETLTRAFQTDSADHLKATFFTVGTGANIILHDPKSGSIKIPMVSRTSMGPDGTPNLGKTSRAAGGAYSSLSASSLRELSEELFLYSIDQDKKNLRILDITYDDDALSQEEKTDIEERKNERIQNILAQYNLNFEHISIQPLHAEILCVPDFTETIIQSVDGKEELLKNRFITAPVGGDYNVDIILYCQLPEGIPMSSLKIVDGEEDFDGNLLKRDWNLKESREWLDLLKNGMQMSQGPKNFFDNYGLVEKALKPKL